jgi:predicted kinase
MNGIILIGLQASGKSSFFLNQFYKTHLKLSMDMLKTRNRERILFNACLEAKQPVVIDNTNPTVKDRQSYIKAFKEHKFEVIGYYFVSRIEECLKRNALRTGKECIPDIGLIGTYNKLELPKLSEGFDKLYYVTMDKGGFKIAEWKNEI